MNYRCDDCGWTGPIPGKGRTCKKCAAPLPALGKVAVKDQAPPRLVGHPTSRNPDFIDPTLAHQAARLNLMCEHANLPYRDLTPGENPDVRLYLNGQPHHYGVIFRNRIDIKDVYCPRCNKIAGKNAKLEGQLDIQCKNMLDREQGGGKCGARITYYFLRDRIKEKVPHGT